MNTDAYEKELDALVAAVGLHPLAACRARIERALSLLEKGVVARDLGEVALRLASLGIAWGDEALYWAHSGRDASKTSYALSRWLVFRNLLRRAQRNLFRREGRPTFVVSVEQLLHVQMTAYWLNAHALSETLGADLAELLADKALVEERVIDPEFVAFGARLSNAMGVKMEGANLAATPETDLYGALPDPNGDGPATAAELAAALSERVRRSMRGIVEQDDDEVTWHASDTFASLIPSELLAYARFMQRHGRLSTDVDLPFINRFPFSTFDESAKSESVVTRIEEFLGGVQNG